MYAPIRRLLTYPGIVFALSWAALLALLFAPLLAGGVIVNPMSDGRDAYITRHFAAVVLSTWHEIPRWNPYIFGGLPFLGAMHGDQVYPISVVFRALFAPAMAIGLLMVLHLWLGAVGLLTFLRQQRISWTASIAGATAYGLSGAFLGLFYAGHDGKIYVLGLLPWALAAILQASRTVRPASFAAWGLLLGLMLLTPHFQMAYYASLLMGAFLILCLFTETPSAMRSRVVAGMAVASVLGLLLAGAQLMPFVEYLPFSPRSAAGSTSTGWEYATSWGMGVPELIGAFWGGFNGWLGTYWGANAFKTNGDYLGLLTGVLAVTALTGLSRGPERRKTWFWAGAVVVGTLWVLAAHTPFYRIPYALLPGIAKTRAPSMMWGVVSLCVAVLAALGVSRVEALSADGRRRWATRLCIGTGVGAILFALASGSVIPAMASAEKLDAAAAAIAGAQVGILLGAFTVLVVAIVAWKASRWTGFAAVAMLLLDLGIQGHRFIAIDPRGDKVYAADAVVAAIEKDAAGTSQPWRVLPLSQDYLGEYLMEFRIRSVLGYHGNELHVYDELLGGKNRWTHLFSSTQPWKVLAVRYLVANQQVQVPGLVPVAAGVPNWLGDSTWVWRVPDPAPWALVAPLAVKIGDQQQVEQIVMSTQFDPRRIVLLPKDAPFGSATIPAQMPEPITPAPVIRVAERQPGVYVLSIDSLAQDGVLVVSENWMPSWTARVDGHAAPVARANGTFLAVPLPANSREVVLAVESPGDRRGLRTSFIGLAGLGLFGLAGFVRRRAPAASPEE